MHIAPNEKIKTFELDYDGKRNRWNGYDASTYARVIERYEARDEARRKYLKEQQQFHFRTRTAAISSRGR